MQSLVQPSDRRTSTTVLRNASIIGICSLILYLTVAGLWPTGNPYANGGLSTTPTRIKGSGQGLANPPMPTPWRKLYNPYESFEVDAPTLNYNRTLVIAKTRNEDTSWIERELLDVLDTPIPLTTAIYVADDANAPLHPPVNKGREAMIYLSYIIDNYEHLPDVSLFMHFHSSAFHNTDLLDSSAAKIIRHLSTEKIVREGYMNLRCHWEPGCPNWVRTEPTWFDDHKEEELEIGKAFRQLFPYDSVPPFLSQPCCAKFAVSRQAILRHPKDRYVFWRHWLERTLLSDQISGRVFEYTWQYIFTSSPTHCPNMHICYCDGYSICFENEHDYVVYTDIQDAMRAYRDESNNMKQNSGNDDKMEWLRTTIDGLTEDLERRKSLAFERGQDRKRKYEILQKAWNELLMHPPGHIAEKYGHWGVDSAIAP